jgi:hypothetical protein
MADFTASTGFRDLQATSAAAYFYFATLHDGSVAAPSGSDTFTAAGFKGELATQYGYTRATKTVPVISALNGNTREIRTSAEVAWTQDGSANALTAKYCCIWVNSANAIVGASLLSTDDQSAANSGTGQTANGGGKISFPAATVLATIPLSS